MNQVVSWNDSDCLSFKQIALRIERILTKLTKQPTVKATKSKEKK